MFENDVKIYGIQTATDIRTASDRFENDVKIYGIQTAFTSNRDPTGLRMM